MVFTGSGFSAVFSSSCMPFLKALMPCATSPIKSEILPRPNSSRTTAITTIQCQMLSEPILQPSKHEWPASRPDLLPKVGAQALKNKDFGHVKRPRQLRLAATVNRHERSRNGREKSAPALALRLHPRRQRQFQIAGFQRLLVVPKFGVVRGRRNGKTGRQPRIQQSRAFQFLQPRQVAQRLQAELRQEGVGGS